MRKSRLAFTFHMFLPTRVLTRCKYFAVRKAELPTGPLKVYGFEVRLPIRSGMAKCLDHPALNNFLP